MKTTDDAEERGRFERVLVDLSSRFASAPAAELQGHVDEGLKAVVKFLSADAGRLVATLDDPAAASLPSSEGVPARDRKRGHSSWLPWHSDEMRRGELIVSPDTQDEALPEDPRERLTARVGRRTSVAVPIRLGGRVLGALSFDLPVPEQWSPARLERLQIIASVFAHALQRRRDEQEIDHSLRFEQALCSLSSLLAQTPLAQMESSIAKGLEHLAQALRLDHAALLEVAGTEAARTISCFPASASALPMPALDERVPKWIDRLSRGEIIQLTPRGDARVPPTQDLEPGGTPELADWPALFVLPLATLGAPLCALSAASSAVQRGPPERLVARLQLAGEMLANAWARRRTHESLGLAAVEAQPVEEASSAEPAPVEVPEALAFEHVLGRSDALRYVLFKVGQVAHTDATVLLLGETGTGKGLIARAIHERSARRQRPMVSVNCAALPGGLVESELFGREKGGFTGAHRSQAGRFELADGGTILLDEIGDLPFELQPKLLRVLQDGELERVGSPRTLKVDVRVIAATNRNLYEEVCGGRFREDLYYRLNVFPITLPTLRERRGDIPELVRHVVARLGAKLGKPIETIPPAVMEALQEYAWPGNVRELESILTRALIMSSDRTLQLADSLSQMTAAVLPVPSAQLAAIERTHISRILAQHQWHIEGPAGAASALGMNPSTLRGRMRKLGIQRPK